MAKCQIKWIDENGNSTADTNEAIMLVRTKDRVQQIAGRGVRFSASEWFPICACHAEQLNKPGMEIWESKPLEKPLYSDEEYARHNLAYCGE